MWPESALPKTGASPGRLGCAALLAAGFRCLSPVQYNDLRSDRHGTSGPTTSDSRLHRRHAVPQLFGAVRVAASQGNLRPPSRSQQAESDRVCTSGR